MTINVYGPVESVVKTWLAGTSVAPLVARSPGVFNIFLAMPPAAPIPSVIISQVGGGPLPRKDIPECRYRLSFDCWGTSRSQASQIARALMGELDGLGYSGEVIDGVYLGTADILSMLWRPDPDSDTARYIVDALITTVL